LSGKDGRFVLIELPTVWIIVLNVAGWPVIQFGLAWAFTKMPMTWFNPGEAFATTCGVTSAWPEYLAEVWKSITGTRRIEERRTEAGAPQRDDLTSWPSGIHSLSDAFKMVEPRGVEPLTFSLRTRRGAVPTNGWASVSSVLVAGA
jgi:hypothetical protein